MQLFRHVAGALALSAVSLWAMAAPAAEREDYRHFLEITGFDVAIVSMQQGAMAGPGIAGDAPGAFGDQWVALAEEVFDPELMLDQTLDMMEAILPDDLLDYGLDFYSSDLGQRLVNAENEAQEISDEERHAAGEQILTGLMQDNPDRVEDYRAMMEAIGGVEAGLRAVTEIQVRYLLAAMAAGSVEIEMSEEELRAAIAEQAPQMRENLAIYSLLSAAFTYRDMSDEDVQAYRAALEEAEMRQIYEILNGIQYEVMAGRYEVLAAGLADLTPQQEL